MTALTPAPEKPSRKIRAFLWMSIALIFAMWVATKVGANSDIALSTLRAIGIGGLFVIGGQALVDSVANLVTLASGAKEKAVSVLKETTLTTEIKS